MMYFKAALSFLVQLYRQGDSLPLVVVRWPVPPGNEAELSQYLALSGKLDYVRMTTIVWRRAGRKER